MVTGGFASATLQDGTADAVLGQQDFSSNRCNTAGGVTAATLCGPGRATLDMAGRLYVSDFVNNRVVSWSNAQGFTNGEPADLVLGQPDFNSNLAPLCGTPNLPPTSHSLCGPLGLTVDRSGNLYVADTFNDRVLRFDHPHTNGQAASLVLGQTDFNSTTALGTCGAFPDAPAVNGRTFCGPEDVAIDASSLLYVADAFNHRVLQFDHPHADGQMANLVLGQPDFASHGCNNSAPFPIGPNARTLCTPLGVAVDRSGALYVADTFNSRVLRFDHLRVNGQMANLVLGQQNFATQSCPFDRALKVSAASLCLPAAIALGTSGHILVADAYDNRVLDYARLRTNGQSAIAVLGQPDFASRTCRRRRGHLADVRRDGAGP